MPHRVPPALLREALAALRGSPAVAVSKLPDDAARPGLYAVYASAATWRELGLGKPPDGRPVYIGKAEGTLATRDAEGHFGMRLRGKQSPTGSSTLRRSLAALLAPARGYRGTPRNPDNPGHFANFGLSAKDDSDLSAWMRRRLRLAIWPYDKVEDLDALETDVLAELLPPLNLNKVITPWRKQVRSARKLLAQEAAREGSRTTGG